MPFNIEADPLVDDFDHWLKHREVIRLRAKGLSVDEIATQMSQPKRTIYRWIAEATNAVREENRSFCQEVFLIHYHRLERLYEIIEAKLASPEFVFRRDVFRAAIDVLDRQSKLLGLDRNRGTRGRNDWLDGADVEELIAEAERLGLKLPERFNNGSHTG